MSLAPRIDPGCTRARLSPCLTCAFAPAACPYGKPATERVSRPFVAQPVPAGDCLWVNVEIVPDAIIYATAVATNQPVAIGITSQTLTFDGGAGPVTVTLPTGVVTFSPDSTTVPTTSFDGNAWQTAVAASSNGSQARRPLLNNVAEMPAADLLPGLPGQWMASLYIQSIASPATREWCPCTINGGAYTSAR